MVTWETVRKETLRWVPLAERHVSEASPSASRKKCTLGFPWRPCFNMSAPCIVFRALESPLLLVGMPLAKNVQIFWSSAAQTVAQASSDTEQASFG